MSACGSAQVPVVGLGMLHAGHMWSQGVLAMTMVPVVLEQQGPSRRKGRSLASDRAGCELCLCPGIVEELHQASLCESVGGSGLWGEAFSSEHGEHGCLIRFDRARDTTQTPTLLRPSTLTTRQCTSSTPWCQALWRCGVPHDQHVSETGLGRDGGVKQMQRNVMAKTCPGDLTKAKPSKAHALASSLARRCE